MLSFIFSEAAVSEFDKKKIINYFLCPPPEVREHIMFGVDPIWNTLVLASMLE